MKKKLLSLVLTVVFVLTAGTSLSALAASDEAVSAAETLHGYGLLNGSGTNADGSINYDLDRAPNRYEAVTMLVRLLGKEEEARSQKWKTPFVDVVDWAAPYVGYAYNNGLTSGTSATTFGGDSLVNASQYLTFILRALGYNSETDFSWNKAWELTDKLGITSGEYNASTKFTRGDVAITSSNALKAKRKNDERALIDTLDITDNYANYIVKDDYIHPKYIKENGEKHGSPGFRCYNYNNELYLSTEPVKYMPILSRGSDLCEIVRYCEGFYSINPYDLISIGGMEGSEEFITLTRTEKGSGTGEAEYTYTYECNGKTLSTPDFTESEKTVDGVHFVKSDGTYFVNVNDFLAYFGIGKTMSLETLDGEYCLVVE